MKPLELRVPAARRASVGCWRNLAVALCALLAIVPPLPGQTPNPVPFVNQPVVPSAVEPGGPDFTLTVNGTGFVADSVVNWNGSPRPTTFVSSTQINAAIAAADVATASTAWVTVVNPTPAGGVSNVAFFHIISPFSPVAFRRAALATGASPVSVITRDFNADGKLDVATANADGNTASILLGNGDGTFLTKVDYATGSGPDSVTAGDFNVDGKLDLAVVKHNLDTTVLLFTVSVLLGNGDGTFQAKVDYATGSGPFSVTAGDFNGDGKLDLAVANYNVNTVSILVGNGDGTFQAKVDYAAGSGPYWVTTGDFNGDGELDLAVANYNVNTVSILLGNGDGTFQAQVSSATGSHPFSVSPGDFNADGKLDLAVTSFSSYTVSVLLGNGDGTFQATVDYATGAGTVSVTTGDFNADGKLDVATANWEASTVSILLGNGDGTFQASVDFGTGANPRSVAAGDFNGDGMLDLATADTSDDTVSVLLEAARLVSVSPASLTFGDQLVATTSTTQAVTLSNAGNQPLSISSITITGANAADFAQTNDCPLSPSTLAAGDSCTINVTFLHENLGEKVAVLTITEDAPGYPQQAVNLTGAVVDPTVDLSPPEIDFGTQPLLITSAAHNVTLTNSGVGRLTIADIHTIGENFAATHDCGITVDEGAHCTIPVTYTPKTLGTHDEAVVIYDNAADSPQIINLRGTSVAATVTLSPGSMDFGEQTISTTSSPQTLSVLNSGSVALFLTSVAVVGSFDYVSHCEMLIPIGAGESCTFDIEFSPSQIGPANGTFTLWDNATGSPHTVSLTGTGLPSATASVTPASLDFGDQEAGTTSAVQPVIVRNTGSDPVLINNIEVTGDFTQAHDCPISPATLPTATSCTIIVSFQPTAPGTRTGTLTVNDNAVGSPHRVSLTGAGTGPGVSLSPNGLDFGGQIVEGSSAAQTVTLTNNGTVALNILSIAITGADAAEFEQTHTCGANLAAAANCLMSVTFKPRSTGAKAAQISITSDAYGTPHGVTLTGTGTDFALNVQSGGSTSATVNAGATATYNLQIEPSGFSGDVALSCAFEGTQPRGASCSVSPSSVALNGTDPAPFTVSVSTTAPALAARNPFTRRVPLGPWARHSVPPQSAWVIVLALLLGIACAAAAFRPVPGNPRLEPVATPPTGTPAPRVVLAAALVAALAWGSCGGESALPPSQDQGTPAGNYTVILSAMANGVTKTTNLGLQVN